MTKKIIQTLILAIISPFVIGVLFYSYSINISFQFFIIFFVEIIIFFIYVKLIYGSFKNYMDIQNIKLSIEKNLEYMDAYQNVGRNIIFPKISIKNNQIIIFINDVMIRKRIEKNIDILSTALPANIIVKSYYLSRDENQILIEFDDIKSDDKCIRNLSEFREYVARASDNEFLIGKEKINLNLLPHGLITGITGSGKTYLTQQLIMQSYIKGYDISILDYKRSYQMFSRFGNFIYDEKEIIEYLKLTMEEMNKRKLSLDKALYENPEVIACNLGFKRKIIFIEEYLALVSVLDTKQKKELENYIKVITTTGRALNIHLVIVMQVAGVDALDSSIKANLGYRVCLGNANETILKTTFGVFSSIPTIHRKFFKGEGYLGMDGQLIAVQVPYFDFKSVNHGQGQSQKL